MALIQDLHAAISRRDWHAVEVAANRLRDTNLEADNAAKDANIAYWVKETQRCLKSAQSLADDNAAKEARIKADDLKILKLEEQLSAEQASHERSGKSRDEWRGKAEALEAKLAAAEKVREAAIELDEAISDDFNIFGAQQKLRAALGGKP